MYFDVPWGVFISVLIELLMPYAWTKMKRLSLQNIPLTNDEEHYNGHLKMMSKKFSTTATCLNINLTFPSTSCWKREVVSKETLKFRRSFGSCSLQYFGSDFIFLLLLQKLQFSDTMQPLRSQNLSSRNSIVACFREFYSLYSFISKIHFNDFARPLIGALLGQEFLCGRYIDNMLTIKGTAAVARLIHHRHMNCEWFLQERIEEGE